MMMGRYGFYGQGVMPFGAFFVRVLHVLQVFMYENKSFFMIPN